MSCLSVKITSSPYFLSKGRVTIKRMPPSPNIQVIVEDNHLKASCGFEDNHLKISCGIVCSVSEVRYLQVSPNEVQWITPDEAIVYMVESNTNWTIITS